MRKAFKDGYSIDHIAFLFIGEPRSLTSVLDERLKLTNILYCILSKTNFGILSEVW